MSELLPSHVLVRVPQLSEAVARYEAAGFTVRWGSSPARAHNALIHFEEGPFLELFDPIPVGADPRVVREAVPPRVRGWIDANGLCEHALEGTESIEEIVAAMVSRGVELDPQILPAERTGPDGVTLRWSLTTPSRLELPFVMSPYEPAPATTEADETHSNGVRCIVALEVETPDPKELGGQLAAMLGGDARVDGRDPVVVESHGFTYRLTAGQEHRLVSLHFDDGRTLAEVLAS